MSIDWPARWDRVWRSLDALAAAHERDPREGDPHELDTLLARYAEPQRRYHTLQHLDECFARLEPVRARAERVSELELALWYHDAVYDPHASDNEARSADVAALAMERAGLPAAARARVRALVMATRHDALPDPGDAALLVDIDLGILAAEPARFDAYEEQIRAEYAWVPSVLFRHKRQQVLRGFLARASIFTSGAFPGDESKARDNLTRSITRLG